MNNLESEEMGKSQNLGLPFYEVIESLKLEELVAIVDNQKEKIEKNKPLNESILQTIQDKLKYIWTYDSNAIEGSTLTLGETIFFIQHGITAEGKNFKDYLDAKNHVEAIEYVYDLITQKRPISAGVLHEINALLLTGVSSTKAIDQHGHATSKPATPEEFKKLPNHVLQPDGSIHYYVDPLQVEPEIDALIDWIHSNIDRKHPAIVAALAHYNLVRIHPFDDGNGRGARLLMNIILIQKGYPPAIVKNEKRRKYIEAITKADRGDLNDFVEFIVTSIFETQESILEDLNGSSNQIET